MSNQKKAVVALLDSKGVEKMMNEHTSVASRIRFLATLTTDRGSISRFLSSIDNHPPVRYQWVRNVLETPLKK